MNRLITLLLIIYSASTFAQGTIEAEEVIADTVKAAHVGDGSRLTGLPNQNLVISETGDTLYITEGNYVIIPGISASNSGTAFANAGPDIGDACETSFNLQASAPLDGSAGQWSFISGAGGSFADNSINNTLFTGQEGETYILQWTVMHPGGSSSYDQVNISIAVNSQTSLSNAGEDMFAIMDQTITLAANEPEAGSQGEWEIISGSGGILSDMNDPAATFTGVPGESYTLRWQHFNECSTSTDEVVLTFSESAAGTPSSNGRYYIPDPKFRQYLQIAYPSVMDGDSLIVAGGPIVDKLTLTNLGVVNLDGLQFLTELRSLIINGDIISIPYFSPKLERFECVQCNYLSIIPEFPSSLDTLVGDNWNIEVIPNLPAGLMRLNLNKIYGINVIPYLPDSLVSVELRFLGSRVTNPPTVNGTANIPSQCKAFTLDYTMLDSFPITPENQSNLEALSLSFCGLTDMQPLDGLSSLKHLLLGGNGLLKLSALPIGLQQIEVGGNPIICVENKPPGVADQLSEYEICPEN